MTTVNTWTVVVGNIGTVYNGEDEWEAQQSYKEYCKLSLDEYGRSSNERITLSVDGVPQEEFEPQYKSLQSEYIGKNVITNQNLCIDNTCENKDVEFGQIRAAGAYFIQDAKCNSCGATWVLKYELGGIENINLGWYP